MHVYTNNICLSYTTTEHYIYLLYSTEQLNIIAEVKREIKMCTAAKVPDQIDKVAVVVVHLLAKKSCLRSKLVSYTSAP